MTQSPDFFESPRIPNQGLCDWIEMHKDLLKYSINCISIGTIVSFDATTQLAKVSINYQKLYKGIGTDPKSGRAVNKSVAYPLLVQVPVVIINGGGGYITFPINTGDTCLLLFSDRELDTWINSGNITTPQYDRAHDLNDAIALVGVNNQQNKISNYFPGIKIFYKNAYVTIDSSGNIVVDSPGKITLNGATDIILNAPKIDSKGTTVVDLDASADAIIRGAELTLGAPSDTSVPYSTEDIRRVWVVTSVAGNNVTLEERRLSLSRPPGPITRVVTVQ